MVKWVRISCCISCFPTPTLQHAVCFCFTNAKSWFQTLIEHLVGRQGQARGAQVHAMYLSGQKRWSQDPPLARPHLRAGSGGKAVLLEIFVYLWPPKGKQFFFFCFVFVSLVVVFGLTLTYCSIGLCYLAVCCAFHCVIALPRVKIFSSSLSGSLFYVVVEDQELFSSSQKCTGYECPCTLFVSHFPFSLNSFSKQEKSVIIV